MKTAIYARMSTDKQNERSPEDQIRACREFAEAKGWTVLDSLIYIETGISGASRHNRPALRELIEDRIDDYDVLLAFDVTRLARNDEDLGWIRNRLRTHRRTAFVVDLGLDLFNAGVKVLGMFGEEYLYKLAADTHRGLRGRFDQGFATGCVPHGYHTEPVLSGRVDHRGNPIPQGYRIEIESETAEVVRRAFDLYTSGIGFKEIARRFNSERVPAPKARGHRGGSWSPTALRSIIMNPIYKGERVWNVMGSVKDHETGRRKRFRNPECEWVHRLAPELAIVRPETWERARATRERRAGKLRRNPRGQWSEGNHGHAPNRKHLLSGLLECGICGNSFLAVYRNRWGCNWRFNRGAEACMNSARVGQSGLEARILSAVETQILVPEHVAYVVDRATEIARAELADSAATERAQKRLDEIEGEINNLIDLAARLGDTQRIAGEIGERERERDELSERVRALPPEVEPEVLRRRIEAAVSDMRALLAENGRDALRQLLGDERLRVRPDEARGVVIEGTAVLDLGMQCQGGAGDRTRTCMPFDTRS